ncbi:STAS domain-containing protein [Amycolatopsis solani]|uniref:STAS domain-containing protein n=1 Tax=Amycolatopsis solani TaxID=3028615 RepID=UPI0025B24E02|nr:STAS domain-containing protein [Amycolatopsis sp. MEP2-6]
MVPEPRSADHELAGLLTAGGHMSLRVCHPGPHTVLVEVSGEVDLDTARGLDAVLQTRIRRPLEEVVVDLSGVTFFSVAGLNSLLRAQLLADSTGAHLSVAPGRSRSVRRLFKLLPADFDSVAANVRP